LNLNKNSMRYLFIASVFLLACNGPKHLTGNTVVAPQNISLNGKLFSSLFQQRAAEYRALCLQGYNAARTRMDNYTAQSAKPKAIITDIDETILDNSPYAVHQAWKGIEYMSADWYDWTDRSAADTMPGAASLLKYAASKNIVIFYITNREERERAATLKNLQRFNLPNADEVHLLTRQNGSSKEARRQQVMQNYEVELLMGDNLADLSALFDHKTEEERKANVDAVSSQFGTKFIIFPNPNYGDWESSLYKYNYKLTQAQKDSVMRSVLRTY
jgi:5'-nucleotidase (lipoprotein e(P4) family)